MKKIASGVRRRAAVCSFVLAIIGISRAAAADPITLMWDPSTDTQAVGYFIYVGTQSGVYIYRYDVGNSTSFVFSNAVAGTPYYFAAAAYAAGYVEGMRTPEISGYSDAPPVLTNPGNQTTLVGQSVTLQLAGSDPYGQPVSYGASGLPSGLTLAQSTGLITGTPLTLSTKTVTATVTDGILSDSKTFTWSVTTTSSGNKPPVLTNPGNQTTLLGQSVSLQLIASDPDGQAISYKATGLPAGVTLHSLGLINGTPLSAGTSTVTVSVSDGTLSASQTFTWSVVSDTTPPTVAITSPTSASRFTVSVGLLNLGGTATDNTGVTQVTWTNDHGGSGLATGTSQWTATIPLQNRKNVITITAKDVAGNVASRKITVTRQ